MDLSYFQKVRRDTPTRLWVNHPTLEECDLALAQGVVGCTTNPSFASSLLRRAPDYTKAIVEQVVLEEGPVADDLHVAARVQEQLVARVIGRFRGLWEESGGAAGFVSIQGSPVSDHDDVLIFEEAQIARNLGPNATPKIPATLPGFRAFAKLVAEGCPTIITEVFSLDQVEYACELYSKVTGKAGSRPPFFMSPITGIFAEHLKKVAKRRGIDVDADIVDWAGVALGRSCQKLVRERSYPVTLLFGGARLSTDFTGLVGDCTAATLNYSTITEILAMDPPVQNVIGDPVDSFAFSSLMLDFADFRQSVTLGTLKPEAFEDFGPVQHFRDAFVDGWNALVIEVGAARVRLGVASR